MALGEKFDCIKLVDINGTKHTRPGYSFWDNTTNGGKHDDVLGEPIDMSEQELKEEEEKLVAKIEEIVKNFLDFLHVTGCDLAPEKCAWYLISHQWKDGTPQLLCPNPGH
jgi:hypothetical protein